MSEIKRWQKEDPKKHLARQMKFEKNHIKQIQLKLNDRTDTDIIDFLETVPNKRALLIRLIREEMSRQEQEEKSQA